jgi:putative transposase
VLIRKAFKFRIYPNQTQRSALAVQFGHARFVYNYYLAGRQEWYEATHTSIGYVECNRDLTELKDRPECPWLRQADSQVLQESLRNLDRAYVNFFEKRAEYPKFKSKHGKQSIRYPQRFKVNGKRIYLPKVGWVKAIFHRPIEGEMKNCTVSKTKSGKYFVSIQCELEVADPEPKPTQVGIDLGLATFATLSTGEKIDKPKYLHRSERRLKLRQRRLSHKRKGSVNHNRARLVLARTHEHVANQRKDFHHKLGRRLADEYGCIAFESLNVNGMLKNHNLAKAISDAAWSQFVVFCEYKAGWTGSCVLRVDRFFPSSKLCSDCGEKNHGLTLNVRQWVCLNCGVIHDRDENAAVNILNQATVGATESHAMGVTTVQYRRSALEAQAL